MFICTCGATVTETAPRSGVDKCELCRTFPTPNLGERVGYNEGHVAHMCYSDPDDAGRCFDCDGRAHSHRVYPEEGRAFEFAIERVERIFADPTHYLRA